MPSADGVREENGDSISVVGLSVKHGIYKSACTMVWPLDGSCN